MSPAHARIPCTSSGTVKSVLRIRFKSLLFRHTRLIVTHDSSRAIPHEKQSTRREKLSFRHCSRVWNQYSMPWRREKKRPAVCREGYSLTLQTLSGRQKTGICRQQGGRSCAAERNGLTWLQTQSLVMGFWESWYSRRTSLPQTVGFGLSVPSTQARASSMVANSTNAKSLGLPAPM